MLNRSQLEIIARCLHSHPELKGSRIGHYGLESSSVINPGDFLSPNYYKVIVIIDEFNITQSSASKTLPDVEVILNESKIAREFTGAAASCILTGASFVLMTGSIAASGVTMGASTIVAVAAWTGVITGFAQCLNGVYRTTEAIVNPTTNSLERMDQNAWYTNTFLVLDTLGVISGAAGIKFAYKNIIQAAGARIKLPSEAILKTMSKAEREQVMKAALKEISEDPQAKKKLVQALEEAFPGRKIHTMIKNGGSIATIRTGAKVSSIINDQLGAKILEEVAGIISDAGGIVLSATPEEWTGSGSGIVNKLGVMALHFVEG